MRLPLVPAPSAPLALGLLLFLSACADSEPQPTTVTEVTEPTAFVTSATLNGSSHKVTSEPVLAGYQNHYQLEMFGTAVPTVGDPMLGIRAAEAEAIGRLDTFLASGAYAAGARAAVSTVGGVGMIGGRTASVLPSGAAALTAKEPAKATAKLVEQAKRQLARGLKVNPYSDNPLLQERLNRAAWAVGAGGARMPRLDIRSPGFEAGVWPDLIGLRGLGVAAMENHPDRLQTWNEDTLRNMGIDGALSAAFLSNRHLTPVQATIITQGLARIPARGRRVVFEYAAEADDPADGLFLQMMVQMAFGYHTRLSGLTEIIQVSGLPIFYNEKGDVVLLLPVDRLPWTAEIRGILDAVSGPMRTRRQIDEIEVWLTGKASATALAESRLRRAKLFEDSAKFLLAPER
ncbi:MAG: hypothetical protein ACPGOV_16590 [Magnetovibrionaceae bacterium]